ncbi:MAG: UbiA family prenyltransferase [Vicinamibacterales bacterium]|jgi:4-hydroxybenzoate polyprenyltransferase
MPRRSRAGAAVAPGRRRARAYLLLARISNLPTVWTNVLAAVIVAGAPLGLVMPAIAAVSLFYMGGMFLNDAFDAEFDARMRADRPIPAGDVSRAEAFIAGGALIAAGEGLLLWSPHPQPALAWGLALAAAITFYDYKHKGQSFGPVVMGLCRGLVYGVAAAAAVGVVGSPVVIAGVVMWGYVIALTWVAKHAGLGHAVPWMLAGICLVDAAMLVIVGAPVLALAAAAGFPLTLMFQRAVPGT